MALGVVLAVSAIAPATASARFDNNPVYFPSPATRQAASTTVVRGSRDERHVTNMVRRSFADQLGQQAELEGDSVHVDSFQCSYAYTWAGATYFTCEAYVGIKPVRARADAASADAEYVYWLLVVDRHNVVSWRIQVPDTCDSRALMEC
jgi:hypothetical protein